MRKVGKYVMTVKLTGPGRTSRRGRSALHQHHQARCTAPWTEPNANGTGAFKLTVWTPGALQVRGQPNYFETGKPYLNGVDIVGISDPVARVNALISGQVDVISDVPAAQVSRLKSAGSSDREPWRWWTPLVMNTKAPPYNDVRVRQAMKLLIDRKQAITVARRAMRRSGTTSSRRPIRSTPPRSRSGSTTRRRQSRC